MKEKEMFQQDLTGWQQFINSWRWLLICGLIFGGVFVVKLNTEKKFEQPQETKTYFSCPADGDIYHGKTLESNKQNIKGVIIPHHLIAYTLIDEVLGKVDSKGIETVVLIGPNHPNRGNSNIQTSRADWETVFGKVEGDQVMVDKLIRDGMASIYEYGVEIEHSICGDIPFVRKYFPKAKVVPLTMKSSVIKEEQEITGKWLAKYCRNCLVIASVDFSHDLTPSQALEADKKSAQILTSLDTNLTGSITADSPATLGTLMWYVKELGISNGTLINRSDANEQLHTKMTSVTSYETLIY